MVEWLFENNQIENLKKHYGLPDFKFDLDHILLMHDHDGVVVVNGREEEDQQSIADSITRIVARFTANENLMPMLVATPPLMQASLIIKAVAPVLIQ